MADLAAFGLQAPAGLGPHEVEIWPENLETVEVFFACQTQWETSPMFGQAQGLRYAAVAAAIDLMGISDRSGVFAGIRLMERAALTEFNNKAADKRR